MIEAMARGCVSIGTRAGGIPELIDEPWLVDKNDWRAIANLLTNLRSHDLEGASLRNAEKASEYDFEHLQRKRQRFYYKFLTDHGLEPVRNGVNHGPA